jgi:hypothetical protein
MATETTFRPGFVQPFVAQYSLTMSNDSGASEETSHSTKGRVRIQIRTWDARKMTCIVRDSGSGETIYNGSALGF